MFTAFTLNCTRYIPLSMLQYWPVVHVCQGAFVFVFTDGVSMGGNAIISVCLNFLTKWPLTLTFCMCMGYMTIALVGLKVKVKVRVWIRNMFGTLILSQGQFSIVDILLYYHPKICYLHISVTYLWFRCMTALYTESNKQDTILLSVTQQSAHQFSKLFHWQTH